MNMEKNVEKYIVTRIRLTYKDGTHSNVKTAKEVYNLESYREYLMVKHDATKVEFTYDTIPVQPEREIRLKIVS